MSKKTAVLLIGIIIIASVLAAGCAFNLGNPTTPASPTNTYDSAQGFSIKYPSDWTKDEPKNGAISVLFRMPTNNDTENLNVQVWNVSANETLVSRTAVLLPAVQSFSDFTQIEAVNTPLAGNPAYKVVYTANIGGDLLKLTQIWTVKNGKEYIITYQAAPNNYDTYASTAQQMIDSFQIK